MRDSVNAVPRSTTRPNELVIVKPTACRGTLAAICPLIR